MCDYSLHAVATRPAEVGETLITTTFRGTATRGFASESDPERRGLHASGHRTRLRRECPLRQPLDLDAGNRFPGRQVRRVDRHIPDRHHDAIEFPDGSHVLVTLLCEGQRATVLQLPVVAQPAERPRPVSEPRATPLSAG